MYGRETRERLERERERETLTISNYTTESFFWYLCMSLVSLHSAVINHSERTFFVQDFQISDRYKLECHSHNIMLTDHFALTLEVLMLLYTLQTYK